MGTYWGVRIGAANGLAAIIDDDGVRIEWGDPDWFGPGRLTVGDTTATIHPHGPAGHTDDLGTATVVEVAEPGGRVTASVRAYHDVAMLVFRLEAIADLDDLATGAYDRPSVGWPVFTPRIASTAASTRQRAPSRSSAASSRSPPGPARRSTASSSCPTARPPGGRCCSPRPTAGR